MENIEHLIEIYNLHKQACDNKKNSYKDPKSNLKVFTKEFLEKVRKQCCDNGCRHCPFKDDNPYNADIEEIKKI